MFFIGVMVNGSKHVVDKLKLGTMLVDPEANVQSDVLVTPVFINDAQWRDVLCTTVMKSYLFVVDQNYPFIPSR